MSFKKDTIRALTEREKVREKLPTFYGSRDNYYHGFKEVLNNATDEVFNNFENGSVIITLHDDCETITIEDTGRGIPIDTDESTVLLFETLFASGKYEVDSGSNSGVNGVGTCCLMYSSEFFSCTSYLGGKEYEVTYYDGGSSKSYRVVGDTDKHGTKITFKLDKKCYTNTVFDKSEIESSIRRISLISKKITFIFNHADESVVYNHTIESYFDEYSRDIIGNPTFCKEKTFSKKTVVERQGESKEVLETADIQVAMGTCVGDEVLQETMLNGNYLKDNGTIYDGIIEGARNYFNKHCKNTGQLKKKDKQITNQDIESCLSFVCRIFSNLVEFESQVKFSTKKEYYKEVAKTYITENLEIMQNENRKDFDRTVQQVLICKRANENNEKAKQVLKKKLTDKIDSINNVVEDFVDCELEKGGEIFFTEGKSALGSIILARDSHFQAGYPLRGKMINPRKNNISKVLSNEEVLNMLRILECGVEIENKFTKDLPKFDINKLRFSKIILTADADSDGKQINILGLANLYKLCPTLVIKGYVYVALPPLFEISVSDSEKYYALTINERDRLIEEKIGNRKYEVHRLKGLGETSKEVMSRTVCNPETRVLQRITVEDIEAMEESFEKWLGKKVDERKEHIEKNLYNYLIEPPVEDIVESKDIVKTIEDNMMEYSADIIFDRAIASVESGLKPSQIRALWTMYVRKNFTYTKSLNVTGAVTQYHPHGSIYPTVVKMAQEDRHHLPLIIGDGNFGQYTSNLLMEASDRYTNVKLSALAVDSLKEVDKHYVDMISTYDGKKKMPLHLPSKYPIILTQASEGMAVGVASKMPSFNFNEVCDAIVKYINTGEKTMLIPDFATFGSIKNNEGAIKAINTTGKGTLTLRGNCIKDDKNKTITINEIPYGVYREDIINKVISLVKQGKMKEVISIKDSTGLKGMGIKITCKKNTNLNELEEKLFTLTPLESAYPCYMNVLTNGMPKMLGVWSIIDKWIEFRKSCIVKGLKHEKQGYEKTLHLLKGYETILDSLDDLVSTIRYSKNIIEDIMEKFKVDRLQAEYISKLSLTDINEDYIETKLKKIKTLEDDIWALDETINSNKKLMNIIISDLNEINNKFKSPRRTKIIENVKLEETVEEYNVRFIVTKDGYIKKMRLTSLRGNVTQRIKEGDKIISERDSNNKADLLIFTTKQNCYKLKANNIPDHKPSILGLYIPSHLQLEDDEYIVDVIPTMDYSEEILVGFDTGRVVRLPLKAYYTKTNRTRVVKALHTDKVVAMHILDKEKNFVIKTDDNRALIINSKDVPLKTTKSSQGVIMLTSKRAFEVVAFKEVDEVKVATLGRYFGGKDGKGAGVGILLGDDI